MMEQISVKPIPSRKWKDEKTRAALVYDYRDPARKKDQRKVDERIHYIWFHYLQLCLNLEDIKYSVPKRGGRGKIISTTKVKVSKDIYKDWDLEKVKKSSFREWYDEDKPELFYEGGFQYSKGSQYHPLVKRFNVFILYHNMMNDKNFYIKGGETKGVIVCGKIVEEIEKLGGQKERYELLDRKDYDAVEKVKGGTKKKNVRKLSNQKRVMKDVVDCENTILAVCEGRFPK